MDRKGGVVMEVNRQKTRKGTRYGSTNNAATMDQVQNPSNIGLLDSDAPELVLFLQESQYHFVTDISMDADSDLIPENSSASHERLLFKRTKWKHKRNSSSSTHSLDPDGDFQHKQNPGRSRQMQINEDQAHYSHSRKSLPTEAVSQNASMGELSTEENGYISEASSMYRSDSLATISSRRGRSRSSADEIRFSDFSASFWGPVWRPAPMRACSGDVSLGSTSSNASAHSFAFPALQAEWNGSPVRMAVADRRQLRKQQSWKSSLLCCRF